ncbi:uracil-DNA glycosylase family protein [Lentisphaera profundi]|uniref:Uracil-DNA glycosylase family protein n=1 Tax=Lentisphaera profundi TaxID=1658616 RepID=A0ABY7VX36_9BACT|nr:uracil-DNA glycosylase family protein [Lentisphaera profundi]WDE97361.1 uracil-DNA glycosylase family protein [Lentisphaera profundi]
MKHLVQEIEACTICQEFLPLGPRPVIQVHEDAKVLIVGQAPGIRVHKSGKAFDDPSGDRLRQWMGISPEDFYDSHKIAIVPMGFCYPGTGKSGDLPPRKECAEQWRQQLLDLLPNIELTIVIGNYAMDWHLKDSKERNLTETVKVWENYIPAILPLPHPSPRNNIWLKKHTYFEKQVIPYLQERIKQVIP